MNKDTACFLACLMAALLVTGCAPKVHIMAPESMFTENKVKKIALLGEGGIRWTGFAQGPDIKVSRKGLEAVQDAIEQELAAKGYELTFSRPIRIIFGDYKEYAKTLRLMTKHDVRLTHEAPGKDGKHIVYEDYMGDREKRREIPFGDPAYEYSFADKESPLREAATGILRKSGCLAGTEPAPEACLGLQDDMLTIHNATGADTICIVDIRGLNFTAGAKSILIPMSLTITFMTGTPVPIAADHSNVSLMCVDAVTGDMLWWQILDYPVAASNPKAKDNIAWNSLQFLPDAGSPLKAKCSTFRQPDKCASPETGAGQDCVRKFPMSPIWECGMDQFSPEPGSIVEERRPPPAGKPTEGVQAEAAPSRQKRVQGRYWNLGLGSNWTRLSDDQPAYDSYSGSGVRLTGGLTLGQISLGIGMSSFDISSKDPAQETSSYTYFSFNVKYDFLNIDHAKWTPWLALEWTVHDYGYNNYLDSKLETCASPALGVDVILAKWLLLRAGWRECSFNTSGPYPGGNADVENFTMDMVFRFRIY